jgi:proprotein convertase subtilisin/kexin type 5
MKYQDTGSGYCEWCHPSCQECWGPTKYQCISCKTGEYVYNHQCFTYSCPGATYLSIPAQRLCEPCQFGCQFCASSQFCYFCTPGYNFYQGWCYLQCPGNLAPVTMNYYSYYIGTICDGCNNLYSVNCEYCDFTSCQKCQQGLYLYRGSVQTVMRMVNGVNTSVKEQCVSVCPLGTYARIENGMECVGCSPNCYNCSSYGLCLQCQSGYNLVNGYCTLNCPSGTYPASASTSTTSSCSNCPTACTSCNNSINCTSCSSTTSLYFSPTLLMTSCVSTCPSQYYRDPSGWCLRCPSTCVSCSNASTCTQCFSGYSIVNGQCTNSSNNSCTSNCGDCSGGICRQCHAPYLLLSNTDNGVVSCVLVCPAGYFATAFSCQKCNATCLSCVNTADNCSACVVGLFQYGHTCLVVCPMGYWANNQTKNCDSCPANCLNCYSANCLICLSGFFLNNNGCVQQCPSGTFSSPVAQMCFNCSSGCSSCIDGQNCTGCNSGLFLFNSSCVSQCPLGTYVYEGDQHLVCKMCVAPCFSCLDSQYCLSCVGGYILNGSICQDECGERYYVHTEQVNYTNQVSNQNFSVYSQCEPCGALCLTCFNSSDNCLSCDAGRFLVGGRCVEKCPDATYNNSQMCSACPPACLLCQDSVTCLVCTSGAVLFNGLCVAACPQGYFAAVSSNATLSYVCRPCNTRCQTCNGDSQYDCQSCTAGYFWLMGMCL